MKRTVSIGLFLFSAAWMAADVDQNLVGHWTLDEQEGAMAYDDSGNGYDGSLVNFIDPNNNWVAGHINNALEFDGIDDYIEISGYYGIGGTHARTVSAWIKLSSPSTGSSKTILSYGDSACQSNWLFVVNEYDKLQVDVNCGSVIGQTIVTADRWHHVAVVLDDWNGNGLRIDDFKLYIDGALIPRFYTDPGAAIYTGTNYPVRIGTHTALTHFFDGLIDDVRIYDRSLSDEEIADLAGSVLNISESDFLFLTEVDVNPADQYLMISNVDGILHWSIDTADKPGWLIITPTSGTLGALESEPVTLSVDITGLPVGLYEYSFEVVDPNAANSPQTVQVDFAYGNCYVGMADYDQWVDVGSPECWCYPRQCHGDADGNWQGTVLGGFAFISTNDLTVLIAGWQVKEPPKGPGIQTIMVTLYTGVYPGACADFDHQAQGSPITGYARVSTNDLNRLITYWLLKESPKGPGVPSDCLPGNVEP